MKKFLTLTLLIAIVSISQAQRGSIELTKSQSAKQECINSSFEKFSAFFSFSRIESEDISTEEGVFSNIYLDNTFPTGEVGTPELPAARKLIAIPQGATPRVIVKSYDETEYGLNDFDIKTLYPHQPSVRKDMKPEDIKFIYNANAYNTKGYDEKPIAEVNVLGNIRAMRFGTLTINPIVYNPSNNTILVRNNIEVEVVFDNADKAATESLFKSTYSIYFDPIYKQAFNQNDIYTEHPDLYSTPVYMMVVVPDEWIETLQPWVEWKTLKGIHVNVYPKSQAGSNYNQIKAFVADKYNEGVSANMTPTFLVLVGDKEQIPATMGSETDKITDLYYSTVDGDYFPDIYCSRMSVSNTTELQNVIHKILTYEKVEGDTDYLAEALIIAGGDGYWNPIVGQPAINYAHTYHFNEEHGFPASGVHKYLNSYSNCYSWINSGVSIVNYTAHGSETGWYDPSLSVSDVNSFTNTDKYFLAIGNCCLAADWGYGGVCFGEAMIRANQKGAYTYIGSCPSTYWSEDYYWAVGATTIRNQTPTPEQTATGVYDGFNMTDMYNTTNSIIFLGNLAVEHAYAGDYETSDLSPLYYWQAYHVLGDGSIMPFNVGVPETNVSEHMDIVPIGVDFYEVNTLPHSMVAISKDGVLHGTAVADSTGYAYVTLDPVITDGGMATIVITRPNTYPLTEELQCAALDGPYMISQGFEINDADNDDIFMFSETGTIGLSIKNVGTEVCANTVVTISTDDEYVEFTTASHNYGDIMPDSTKTINDAFTVHVLPTIPNNHLVECMVNITNGEKSWEAELSFKAYAPTLNLASFGYEGHLLPGKTLNITATFTNTGNANVTDATATYTTTSEYITVNTSEPVVVGDIEVGRSVQMAFSVTVSPDVPFGTVIPSTITINADEGYAYDAYFEPFVDICNVAVSSYPHLQDFESEEIPGCWTQQIEQGSGEWIMQDGGYAGHPQHAHSGNFNAFMHGDNATTVKLVSPILDLSNVENPQVNFFHAQSVYNGHQDVLRVYYKNASDGEWMLLKQYSYSNASWKERTLDLPNPTANYYVAFEAECNGGYGVVLDDVTFTGTSIQSTLGDANGDGQVNTMDITALVNYFMGQNPTPFIFNNADVNADGIIDVLDIIQMVNIIMSGK